MQEPQYYKLKEDVSPCIFGPVHKQRWSYACAKQMTDRLIYGKQRNSVFLLIAIYESVTHTPDTHTDIDTSTQVKKIEVIKCIYVSVRHLTWFQFDVSVLHTL
jgi:hypothetical protein